MSKAFTAEKNLVAYPDKMQNRLSLKEAYSHILQAASILMEEERTQGIKGSQPLLDKLQSVAETLQETHMECIATHDYDIDAILGQIDQAQNLLMKMRKAKVSSSADAVIDEIFNFLDSVLENIPQMAKISDDAVDDVLIGLSRQSQQPIANMLDYAVSAQFQDWNVEHSSTTPWAYRDYAEELKALLDSIVAHPGKSS